VKVGSSVDARGTSRLCSSCKKSFYLYLHDDKKSKTKYKVENSQIKLDNQNWNIYNKTGANVLNSKEASTGLYDYMRPPMKTFLKRQERSTIKYTDKELEYFQKRRGDSAIFTCPKCGHVSDADIQASLIIGLKEFFNREYSSQKQNFEKFMKYVSGLEIPTVGLEVD